MAEDRGSSGPGAPDQPIRVLVVDDSVVVRRLVVRAVEAEPDLELAGIASNGQMALQRVGNLLPDVVILDLAMPGMDGLSVLSELRRDHQGLPVVIFSSQPQGPLSSVILDALSKGKTELVLKPTATRDAAVGSDYVRDELLPVVREIVRARRESVGQPAARPAASRPRTAVSGQRTRVDAVVVGVSTGGPEALATLFRGLHQALPVPVLIVQHMPAGFTKLLAERLDRMTEATVGEAVEGQLVEPGMVLFAPGGRHMELARVSDRVVVRINDGPRVNFCRPSADVLFRSAARVYGRATLAVVLTGMGTDGLVGSRAVHGAGGSVLAQSAATSTIASMPMAVADFADAIIPLDRFAAELVSRIRADRWT
jgi:two-component system chemotaxis response regulator CheB